MIHVALEHIPRALVDDERRLAGEARVHVRFRDDPRGRIRNALRISHSAPCAEGGGEARTR